MLLTLEIFAALQLAVFGLTFELLCEPGHILNPYWMLLDRMKDRKKWYSTFAKPLGWCTVCFTGQVAIWWYIIMVVYFDYFGGHYSASRHILFAFFTMFFVIMLKRCNELFLKAVNKK